MLVPIKATSDPTPKQPGLACQYLRPVTATSWPHHISYANSYCWPQVTALEGRVLRLLADEEVASVTAGLELQQQAAAQLQAARDSLAGIEQVRISALLGATSMLWLMISSATLPVARAPV